MDANLITILTIGVLFIFLLVGLPIFASLVLAGLVGLFLLKGVSGLGIVPGVIFNKLSSQGMVALPVFILMGQLMFLSAVGKDLFKAAECWLNWLPGSLGVSAISACTAFGAMCGSSVAGSAAIGVAAIPEMVKRGYDKSLATGTVAAAGGLAMLIPPSAAFIMYGTLAEESIGKLFIAGIGPGIVLACLDALYVILRCKITPRLAPRAPAVLWRDRFISLRRVLPSLGVIFLVLGSMFFGIATPSEAGAVGVFAALFVCALARALTWRSLYDMVTRSFITSAAILALFAAASLFAHTMSLLYIPQNLSEMLGSLKLPPLTLLVVIWLFILLLGCFLDGAAIVVITTPILLPTIMGMGLSPLWFGVFLVLSVETAGITPPVGLNLFVVKSIAPPDVSMGDIVKGSVPFVIAEFASVALFTLVPSIALWLPEKMM